MKVNTKCTLEISKLSVIDDDLKSKTKTKNFTKNLK